MVPLRRARMLGRPRDARDRPFRRTRQRLREEPRYLIWNNGLMGSIADHDLERQLDPAARGLPERIVAEIRPDVLCLQEIKVEDDLFPGRAVPELGFEHLHVHGQKAYHGVAVLSKLPLDARHSRRWCGIEDSRHAICTLPGGIELHNFYIPAGGDVPDPGAEPRSSSTSSTCWPSSPAYFGARRGDGARMVLVGDLNIAPAGDRRLEPPAAAGGGLAHAGRDRGAAAACRRPTASSTRYGRWCRRSRSCYTWWSYRNRDWEASDRGRRLDHVWLSPALAPAWSRPR